MALNASKFPPKSTTDLLTDGVYLPIPLEAFAGEPATDIISGDSEWDTKNRRPVPAQKPEPVTIEIAGQNLVDIIADLTARIVDLETP